MSVAENECMVSVLCTAYNHEKYIAQTLQCIVDQQTDFAFELLVNDDASTDSTAAIISLVVVFPTLPVIWTKGMSNRSRYAFARAFRARRVSST